MIRSTCLGLAIGLAILCFFGGSCFGTCSGFFQDPKSVTNRPDSDDKLAASGSTGVQQADSKDEAFIFSTDFDGDNAEWILTDPKCWKKDSKDQSESAGKKAFSAFSLFQKQSEYKPKFRSPIHQAILKEPVVDGFRLDVEVLSTHKPYGHRDVCLFFGYENESRFYYVHLGQKADPHCNQIFLVNDADRKKISATTSEGTPWSDDWHQVRVIRDVESGAIEVYFDDMTKPVMTANDKTFRGGKVGIGSFDDTADFRHFRLRKLGPAGDSAKGKR